MGKKLFFSFVNKKKAISSRASSQLLLGEIQNLSRPYERVASNLSSLDSLQKTLCFVPTVVEKARPEI